MENYYFKTISNLSIMEQIVKCYKCRWDGQWPGIFGPQRLALLCSQSHGPSKQGSHAEDDLERQWTKKTIPPLALLHVMLFDGESPLRCTAVDILVFFLQVFSPHLAPHLVCVRLIFNDDEKHLGWPNGCVQNNEGSDNDAHGKTSSHPRGSTAMKCGRSTLNINMNKTQ